MHSLPCGADDIHMTVSKKKYLNSQEKTAGHLQEATETAAMASGRELHRVLEAEVKEEAEVEMATAEDAWALRLLSCIQCFRQLMRRGMTREVYLFGRLQVTPAASGNHCTSQQLPTCALPCQATEKDVQIEHYQTHRRA